MNWIIQKEKGFRTAKGNRFWIGCRVARQAVAWGRVNVSFEESWCDAGSFSWVSWEALSPVPCPRCADTLSYSVRGWAASPPEFFCSFVLRPGNRIFQASRSNYLLLPSLVFLSRDVETHWRRVERGWYGGRAGGRGRGRAEKLRGG